MKRLAAWALDEQFLYLIPLNKFIC